MARPLHPRRGAELRPLPSQPPRSLIDPATLAELRELVASLAEKVGDPREDTRALARGLATQARKLDEIAAMQTDAIRRLAEVDLRTQAGWRMWLAVAFTRATSMVRNRLSRRTPGLVEGPDAAVAPNGTSSAWILTDAPSAGIERVVMVLLFGLGSEQQQVIVARLLDGQLPPGMAPVFVTDGTDFEPFRSQRAYFERLPLQARSGTGAHRDYELYAARRFTLLCDKWKPLRVVAFGSVAARRLEAWRQSTHVAPAIRELLAGSESI